MIRAIRRRKAESVVIETNTGPVSQLPAKVLHEIFDFVAAAPAYDHKGMRIFTLKPSVSLTGVCRHWRGTALTHASLWTRITLPHKHPRWISIVIERSQQYPLHILINRRRVKKLFLWRTPSLLPQSILDIIQPEFHRVAEIRVHTLETNWTIVPPEPVYRPAPALRRLSLHDISTHQEFLFTTEWTPNLDQLILSWCSLPEESGSPYQFMSTLTKVTRLTMEHITPFPTPEQLTDILRSMPHMKELVLCDSIEPYGPYGLAQSPATPTTALNTLKFCKLEGTIQMCAFVLACIGLEPGSKVILEACYHRDDYDLIVPFCKGFGKTRDGKQVTYLEDISASQYWDGLTIRGGGATTLDEEYHYDYEALQITVTRKGMRSIEMLEGFLASILCVFITALPTQHLQFIEMTHLPLNDQQWGAVLRSMPQVEAISFHSKGSSTQSKEFIHALSRSGALSKLKKLTLYEFPSRSDFDSLCNYLKERRSLGWGLELLSFASRLSEEEKALCRDRYPEFGLVY